MPVAYIDIPVSVTVNGLKEYSWSKPIYRYSVIIEYGQLILILFSESLLNKLKLAFSPSYDIENISPGK